MKKMIDIDYSIIYHSKLDGDYKIIKEVEKSKFGHRRVIIKWINTGNEQEVDLQVARSQEVRDKKKRSIDYNKIYYSNNFGPFKILQKMDYKKDSGNHILIQIQFIETGTIKIVRLADALIGNIKDEYRLTIHGIACKGNASSYHPAYNTWENMINRCYNKNYKLYYNYGAQGITVCKKWLCFEYFLEDLPYIDGYENWKNNPDMYSLDKDYKQMYLPKKEKIYSLETCCFIPIYENTIISRLEHSKSYIGVRQIGNLYHSNITINNDNIFLGVFETPELAAAAYNNALLYFHPSINVMNNVPYIPPEQLIKLNLRPKILCEIIK